METIRQLALWEDERAAAPVAVENTWIVPWTFRKEYERQLDLLRRYGPQNLLALFRAAERELDVLQDHEARGQILPQDRSRKLNLEKYTLPTVVDVLFEFNIVPEAKSDRVGEMIGVRLTKFHAERQAEKDESSGMEAFFTRPQRSLSQALLTQMALPWQDEK